MKRDIVDIDRLVDSVGSETFIKYYYDFKTMPREKLLELFNVRNEPWKNSAKEQKISNAKRIFNENRDIEAVEHVLFRKKTGNIPNGVKVKEKAVQILKKIYPETEATILDDINTSNRPSENFGLAKSRLQQGKYRQELLNYWGGCAITNCQENSVLIASHIKPYSISLQNEKYDLYNGLLLTANFDKLFDSFLISFDQLGKIKLSKRLNEIDLRVLNITGDEEINPFKINEHILAYLKYHFDEFEKLENDTSLTQV